MKIFKKRYIIGLDIGSSSAKLVQFLKKEDELTLVRICFKEFNTKDSISVLKDLFKGVDIEGSEVIACINCPRTTIKILDLPYMPRRELHGAVMMEARNCFPFSINDCMVDFQVLYEFVEKNIRKYKIVVAVSPRTTIGKHLSLLNKSGIRPTSIIPSIYAFQKLVQHLSIGNNLRSCFIDIGKVYTELLIFNEERLIFTRKIPIAGEDFTRSMVGVLASDRGRIELSLAEAERIKIEEGIPAIAEARLVHDKISTSQLLSMLRIPLERLASEIERCLSYYRERFDGGAVHSIRLFGRGAQLKGITHFLSDELVIEVKPGDAIGRFKRDSEKIGDEYKGISHCVNLAIGAALADGDKLNLLPPEIKEKTKRVIKRGLAEAIFATAIFAMISGYIGMRLQVDNLQQRISGLTMELFSLRPHLEELKKRTLISRLLQKEPYWGDVFKELSNIIPKDIYLTEMIMKDRIFTVHGVARSGKPEEVLSGFMKILENSIFKNVRLVTIKRIENTNKFEIDLEI